MKSLEQKRLCELFDYDETVGNLVWKSRPVDNFPSLAACNAWNARYPGTAAGTVLAGYRAIKLDGLQWRAHRIIWCLATGEWLSYPEFEIDHINGNRLDNRLSNLRKVTRGQNARNIKLNKRNKTGISGIFWDKVRHEWLVSCGGEGPKTLGRFASLSEAICVRKQAELDRGFHPNHGRAAA